MIATLRGKLTHLDAALAVVDVGGVGYEVQLSRQAAAELALQQEVNLFIAENIREDTHLLFGFIDPRQRALYYQLNSVTGVGPKATMAILSAHSVEEIEQAILAGNIAIFSAVSGVGRKTASRIVLDLRGKLEFGSTKTAADDPAYLALTSLGYTAKQAAEATKDLPADMQLDDKVREALKVLAK